MRPRIVTTLTLKLSAIGAAALAQCGGGPCPPTPAARSFAAPESVCRLRVVSAGVVGYGSGTLVHVDPPRALVLTCNHLFESPTDQIEAAFDGRQRFAAERIASDSEHDLAVLLIATPGRTKASLGAARAGEWLTAGGFGGDGRYQAVRGPVAGYATPVGATTPSIRIRGAVRPGDSGGPVMDDLGRLVGVVWGVRRGETYATVGSPVSRIIASAKTRLTTPRSQSQAEPLSNGVAPERESTTGSTPPSDGLEERLDGIERGLQQCEPCRCHGDCVGRDELDRFALRTEVDALLDRKRTPASPSSTPRQALLQIAANALGVGGPIGAALLAAGWLAQLRSRNGPQRKPKSRGRGGPRDEPFRS